MKGSVTNPKLIQKMAEEAEEAGNKNLAKTLLNRIKLDTETNQTYVSHLENDGYLDYVDHSDYSS